jgi:hypothetical protein
LYEKIHTLRESNDFGELVSLAALPYFFSSHCRRLNVTLLEEIVDGSCVDWKRSEIWSMQEEASAISEETVTDGPMFGSRDFPHGVT